MNSPFSLWFEYDQKSNQKILDILRQAAENAPTDAIKLYSHILGAHEMWNSRVQGRTNTIGVWDILDWDAMALYTVHNMENTMDILALGNLETKVDYKNMRNEPFSNTIEDIFFHLLTHSMFHRGQIARILRENEIAPPETNYISFRR